MMLSPTRYRADYAAAHNPRAHAARARVHEWESSDAHMMLLYDLKSARLKLNLDRQQ